jgi:bifunctional DNase/RNase
LKLIQLDITAIRASDSQNNAYVLLLSEIGGNRQLPIVIGWCEARSIAIALDGNEEPERPLTHDLFNTFANSYDIHVSKVVIHTLNEGVFHSSFYCKNKEEKEREIDARTSDSIAIAIRCSCPIFTSEDILSKAGIIVGSTISSKKIEKKKSDTHDKSEEKLKHFTLEKLNKLLKDAIEAENYEYASILRDEIKRRK